MIFGELDPRRFAALAGYTRHPHLNVISEEIAWLAPKDERVLGVVLLDRNDKDFVWAVLGRDEMLRYRAIDVKASIASFELARDELIVAMRKAHAEPTEAHYQGDAPQQPIDFFADVIADSRRNRIFKILASDSKYSPAREMIRAMMRYHSDVDGNFVQNFQTAGFDARLWELYIWATFTELGFARKTETQVPDFIFHGPAGALAIEAATANPPDHGNNPRPSGRAEFIEYLENYLPVRLSGPLKNKLNRKPSYWDEPVVKGLPFCIALQDFSGRGSMRFISSVAVEYVFGVRHSMNEDKREISRIKAHRYGKLRAQSGFFNMPGAENVSAILVNSQGTITKFNRLAFIAGFGNQELKMVRTGFQRNDGKVKSTRPKHFKHHVNRDYVETWVEGMVVLHNPNAKMPLDPSLIPGAAHEFLQPDGRIMTLLPDFHPMFSQTQFVGTFEGTGHIDPEAIPL